jgi:hypothetical protein
VLAILPTGKTKPVATYYKAYVPEISKVNSGFKGGWARKAVIRIKPCDPPYGCHILVHKVEDRIPGVRRGTTVRIDNEHTGIGEILFRSILPFVGGAVIQNENG